MTSETKSVLDSLAQSIYDKKGFNILALDVSKVCTMTDFFIIAEGSVDRHVRAISLAIRKTMKELKREPLHVEGEQDGDWVVIDYGDIVVHIFIPDLREKYSLENLWHDGKIVDVNIEVSALREKEDEQ